MPPDALTELTALAPFALPDPVTARIVAGYTEPHRRYHTLRHLAEMARSWRDVEAGPGWRDPRATWLALLFHDVVYDLALGPGGSEEASARLLGELVPASAEAQRLVRLTAAHGHEPEGLDPDAAHFLDADMAILGAEPERFDEYEAQVRAEYVPFIGEEAYGFGRRAFLAGLAEKPRIYASDFFHARLDARARANLARVLGERTG